MASPIARLNDFEQSPWYDNLARTLLQDGGLEQLSHDAVAERPLELRGAGFQRLQPGLARVDAGRRDDSRLADPRRALHDDRTPLTGGRRLGARPDHVELHTPFEELPGLAARHRAPCSVRGSGRLYIGGAPERRKPRTGGASRGGA